MSFAYNNVKKEDASSLTVKASAAYSSVSGSADVNQAASANSLVSNSAFNCKSYGGNIAIDTTSFENAKSNYPEWVKGINDVNNQTFVDAGNLSNDEQLLPIWKLIDEEKYPDRYNAIKDAYNEMLNASGKNIATLQDVHKQTYIKDVYIGQGDTWELAFSDLISKSTEEIHCLWVDLNWNVRGSDFLYLGYTLTTNPQEAITDIEFRTEEYAPSSYPTYTSGSGNLFTGTWIEANAGDGGRGDYVYLYYTRETNGGKTPLIDLFVEYDGNLSNRIGSTGWSRAKYIWGGDMNLNSGERKGASVIYLWMRRLAN